MASSSVSLGRPDGNLLSSAVTQGVFVVVAVLLAIASVLFIVRVGLVVWRHVKQPLYEDVSAEGVELTEIAAKQRKIYC